MILFFGRLKDVAGTSQLVFPGDSNMDIPTLIGTLGASNPELEDALRRPEIKIAINQEMLAGSEGITVCPDDEIAFMPPLSGG